MPVLIFTLLLIISAILLVYCTLIALQHFNKINLHCLLNVDYYISNSKVIMFLYVFFTTIVVIFFLVSIINIYVSLTFL